MRALWAVALACALLACERTEPDAATDVAQARLEEPSPLLAMDPDRLYMILHFSNAAISECGSYYETPEDPRYARFADICARKELELVDWLRANGVENIKPEHIRQKAFWEWRRAKYAEIVECRKRIRASAKTPSEMILAPAQCDPVGRLPDNELGMPDMNAAGIRKPS
jgi:hypothetical protein